MNSEDLALQFSNEKPGYELVGYASVAVPLYRLALSTITLERKRIPPVSEFVLRSIGIGISDPAEIKNLLGLTREMVNETVVSLAHEDYIAFTRDPDGKAGIALTPKGQHGIEEATAVSAQTRDAELDYDALLGQPVPFSIGFLEPESLRRPLCVTSLRALRRENSRRITSRSTRLFAWDASMACRVMFRRMFSLSRR